MRAFLALTLGICLATPGLAQTNVAETVGLKAFETYCLDPSGWQEDPQLSPVHSGDLSGLERRAILGGLGGEFRFFKVSGEPRVLVAFQWEETVLRERARGQQRVVGLQARCVVFTHEPAWQGVEQAMEELTGISGRVSNMLNQETLILIDIERARKEPPEPWSFTVSRAHDTIMYRAVM